MSNQVKTTPSSNEMSINDIQSQCVRDQEVIAAVCKSAFAQKRVSNGFGLVEVVVSLFDYFSYFNTLTPDDTVVSMQSIKSLDDIYIPSEFKSFITPTSVKMIAGNRRLPEMLKLQPPTHNKVKDYSYYEYVQLVDKFRSYFKKDGSTDVVTLSSLKKEVSLMDVLSISCISGCVNYDSEPYYPVFLNDWMECVIGSSFLQDDADTMIRDFCAKMRF